LRRPTMKWRGVPPPECLGCLAGRSRAGARCKWCVLLVVSVCLHVSVCSSLSINGRWGSSSVITDRSVRRCLACLCTVVSLGSSAMPVSTDRRRRASRCLPATNRGSLVSAVATSVYAGLHTSAAQWRRAFTINRIHMQVARLGYMQAVSKSVNVIYGYELNSLFYSTWPYGPTLHNYKY